MFLLHGHNVTHVCGGYHISPRVILFYIRLFSILLSTLTIPNNDRYCYSQHINPETRKKKGSKKKDKNKKPRSDSAINNETTTSQEKHRHHKEYVQVLLK